MSHWHKLLFVYLIFINAAHGDILGFPSFEFLNLGAHNPFTQSQDGKVYEVTDTCKHNDFPMHLFDPSVSCSSEGDLVLATTEKTITDNGSEDSAVTLEGELFGLYAANANRYLMVQLKNAAYDQQANCPIRDAYIYKVSGRSSERTVRILHNFPRLVDTVQVKIQGCEMGRPQIVEAEAPQCIRRKCRKALWGPSIYNNR